MMPDTVTKAVKHTFDNGELLSMADAITEYVTRLAEVKKAKADADASFKEEMGGIKNCPTTHALDALGPAMCRAARMGVLKSTNRVIRSKRPEAHGNRHTVWTSNYYGGKA